MNRSLTYFLYNALQLIENNQKMKKPHNYYCHRTQPSTQNLPKGYQVIDKIGQGAFGEVYKVFNLQTSSIEVIKKTKATQNSNALIDRQSEIMSEMENSDGFARIKDKGKDNGCLVMTLLGQNLQDIIDKSGISVFDMKRIAYQCIIRLKELHDKGYVHRDLKPENILMGNQNNPHKIYIVDFGLSSTFKKGSTVPRKVYNGEIGTIKYCPLASHYGFDQYPKDDLESLGYILAYMVSKKLPWSGLPKDMQQTQKYKLIKTKKQSTQIDQLAQGIGCLKKYFKSIKTLKIGCSIDYDSLLQFFKIECKDIYCYSFCKANCFAKLKEQLSSQITEQGIPNGFRLNFQKTLIRSKEKGKEKYEIKEKGIL